MKPTRTWKHEGPTRCSGCGCIDRTCYIILPDRRGEFCWGCVRAAIGKRLQEMIADRFEQEPPPADVARFIASCWQIEFPSAVEAIRLRLYATPNEARAAGYASWDGALRFLAVPLRWLLGQEAWLDLLIQKINDRNPGADHG
ncbi:hypothetical protein UFOVP1382_208 [uncultured Caudovirales phage]|uniref:Uncharacterized protein n=1 Tax=uncultured Caudovirales phage TaxID=2100421 RepID=A0A6J5S5E5_9CAUD|nr:hypothetical protein UFOVP1382_208 [uncultured Caudovirales phage]